LQKYPGERGSNDECDESDIIITKDGQERDSPYDKEMVVEIAPEVYPFEEG
jgi:hypothetical protein